MDYGKLTHLTDALVGGHKQSATAPKSLPKSESVLDKMEIRSKISDDAKTPSNVKVMILDDTQILRIMNAPRDEKRKILSRLTDSQRRRMLARYRELQKVKDDSSVDKLNLVNLDSLLNNCMVSPDDYNLQLLAQWKSVYEVPAEIEDFVTAVENKDTAGIDAQRDAYMSFCDKNDIHTQISAEAGPVATMDVPLTGDSVSNEAPISDFGTEDEEIPLPEFNEVSEEVSDSVKVRARMDCLKFLAGGVKDIWSVCDCSIMGLSSKYGCAYEKVASVYSAEWTNQFAAYQQSVVDSRNDMFSRLTARRVMDAIIDEIADEPLLDKYTGEEVVEEEEKPILSALSEALEAYANGDSTLLDQIASTTVGGEPKEQPLDEESPEVQEDESEEDEVPAEETEDEVPAPEDEFGDEIVVGEDKVKDSTGDEIRTEIEGTEIGKDDDGNTVIETKNDEGEIENVTIDDKGQPVSDAKIGDGLMSWIRGGRPSKNLVNKFASWVQGHMNAKGGSLTKNAKTYLVVKLDVPNSISIEGVDLNLAKLKRSNSTGSLLAYFAPEGSYKSNETNQEDTVHWDDSIKDSSQLEVQCPIEKLDEAAKEQEREDAVLAKELAQLLKLIEKGAIKDSAYSLVNPNTGNVLNSYDDLSDVEADANSYIDEGNDVVIYAQGKPYKYWNDGHWSEVKDSVNVLVDSLKSRVPALQKYNFKVSDCAPVICPCEAPLSSINPPMSRSEYYDMCPVCPDYFDLVVAQYPTQLCPNCNEYDVQQNGLCVNPSSAPQMYYPYNCSLDELSELLGACDSADYTKVVNEHCCPMSDALHVAALTNNLSFIDNTFYKKHVGDSAWVFDEVPACLQSFTDKPGSIKLVTKATDSSISLFGQYFELS